MIVIIDYKTANIGSMLNMLNKIGARARVATNAHELDGATQFILPGIGHFDTCAKNLRKFGFVEALLQKVTQDKIPLMGVCVGAQLLTHGSDEGDQSGLSLINAQVKRFNPSPDCKIPHMGWNQVVPKYVHSLFQGDENQSIAAWRFYFVHSYYMQCNSPADVLATTQHGQEFASAICREHVAGLQFHPEKSHRFGLQLLKNFALHGISNEQVRQ